MNISVLCSDSAHPIFRYLGDWAGQMHERHQVQLHTKASDLTGGDFLFLVSCTEIVPARISSAFTHALVIHESDLPLGRGWSPLAWQILEGSNDIVVSLIEVAEKVDRGAVWKKATLHLDGHELIDEIVAKLFVVKKDLMEFAIANADQVVPQEQHHEDATYYPRRSPADSRIDPEKTIAEQFNLLRIVDAERYPAFFEFQGHRFRIQIEDLGVAPSLQQQ